MIATAASRSSYRRWYYLAIAALWACTAVVPAAGLFRHGWKLELAKLERAGAAVDVRRTSGKFSKFLAAGDGIYGKRYRCSLGFNVQKGGVFYFLTAGHCGKVEKTWWTSANRSTLIGATQGYSFPGNDYALVRYDNTSLSHPGGYTIGDAFVGEKVTRDGDTTGVHSGTVTALNVTVRYQGGGTVRGMIQTNVCAEGGDSGALSGTLCSAVGAC